MKIDKEAKEKLDYLASSICDKYCRYPFIWDDAKYGSLIDSEICCHCPITMFMEYAEVEDDHVSGLDQIKKELSEEVSKHSDEWQYVAGIMTAKDIFGKGGVNVD